MSVPQLFRVVLVTASIPVTVVAGCGGPALDPFSDTSSSSAAGGGMVESGGNGGATAGGAGGEGTPEPCSQLTAPDMPEASVAWVTKGDSELTYNGDVALDWAFTYAVNVPSEDSHQYTLELERCTTFDRHSVQCDWTLLRVPDGCDTASIRYGLDPGGCPPGDALHEFTLRLRRRLQVVSEDSFSMLIHCK